MHALEAGAMAEKARSFRLSQRCLASSFNSVKGIKLKSPSFNCMRWALPAWWMGIFVCPHLDRF
jgi:hypothetical protein